MAVATNLGFPRIGPNRELKRAVEAYWAGKSDQAALLSTAAELRKQTWLFQKASGISHVPSNDFSFYDQVLDTSVMVGAIPSRYDAAEGAIDLDTYFAMARGDAGGEGRQAVQAMEMTKWFDTNYHYIVPEFEAGQTFTLRSTKPVDEFLEARQLGVQTRPVLVGPVTYLMVGRNTGDGSDTLNLLDSLLPVYENVLKKLAAAGAEWVQIDEPMLGMTLTSAQRAAFGRAYSRLAAAVPTLKILVAVYFSDLRENLQAALALPVAGIHIDLVRGPGQMEEVLTKLPDDMTVSLGIVDGRNIWKTDLSKAVDIIAKASATIGNGRVLVGPSCSLLHSPVDLAGETALNDETKSWLAFARQKVAEIVTISRAVNEGREAVAAELASNAAAMESRRTSPRIHNPAVKERVAAVSPEMVERGKPFTERQGLQHQSLRLPNYPTTTIGSFPQTNDIRKARASHNRKEISDAEYETFLKQEIEHVIRFQEKVGLDVLVHGEPERNDMVEYFGQQMQGYASTKNGWVQSYGSRAVKPPIIFGDVSRPHAMTVDWITYAQSLTDRPVKGMLTGPVTMLQWSFVRNDQPRSETCKQLALAIRDEVVDLERAGIRVIQVDEPAIREGLPLRREDWDAYLAWAVESFRIATAGVEDRTQVHTHMCYAAYDDIIDAVAAMDADVISMENSRSDGTLLETFHTHPYPNEIGPGVYDIHSPRVADTGEMTDMLDRAKQVIGPEQLWVNPDCGLKTRRWPEVEESLTHMVEAAKSLRD